MLSLATVLLATAVVASRNPGARDRASTGAGLGGAVGAVVAATLEHGVVPGLLVTAVAVMTAASVMVLILAPRPGLARPVALACALAGALCLVGGLS